MPDRQRQTHAPVILAIDADYEVASLYQTWLSKRGYDVHTVPGKISALEELNDDVELIIVGDFAHCGEWLNDFCHSRYAHIPVIVASGRGDILQKTKGDNNLGALTKPFHMEELSEFIEVLLSPSWKKETSEDKKSH